MRVCGSVRVSVYVYACVSVCACVYVDGYVCES